MVARTTHEMSQGHVLRDRLEEAGVAHGETVRATIPHVMVRASQPGLGIAFFCNVPLVKEVRHLDHAVDPGAIPDLVSLTGLNVDTQGYYDLVNVKVHINGSIQVMVDEESHIVLEGSNRSTESARPFEMAQPSDHQTGETLRSSGTWINDIREFLFRTGR